jgi:RNA polymerase sigma-70 factor (ECF subfamily)
MTAEGRRPGPDCVAAWRQFYQQCDPLIRRFVRIYVSKANDTDDCTQEVWVRLIRRLRQFDYDSSRGKFSSWLYRVVRSATADYFRHEYRVNGLKHQAPATAVPPDDRSDPAKLAEQMESDRAVDAILMTIRRNVSRPNYDLLYMRWVQGKPVEDVASALQISNKQVWYREPRARKKLRSLLSDRDR